MDSPPSTVMVVDDNAAFASRLATFVEGICNARVVCMAASAEEGLERIARHEPSFVLLDVCMGGMSGLDAIESFRDLSPDSQVVVVSSMPEEYGDEARRRGALAYIPKEAVADELPKVLGTTRRGAPEQ